MNLNSTDSTNEFINSDKTFNGQISFTYHDSNSNYPVR